MGARLRRAAFALFFFLSLTMVFWLSRRGLLHPDALREAVESLGINLYLAYFVGVIIGTLMWIPIGIMSVVGTALVGPFAAVTLGITAFMIGSTPAWWLAKGEESSLMQSKFLQKRPALALLVETGLKERTFTTLLLLRSVGGTNNLVSVLAAISGAGAAVFYSSVFIGEITGFLMFAYLGDSALDMLLTGEIWENLNQPSTYVGLGAIAAIGVMILWCQHDLRRSWERAKARKKSEAEGDVEGAASAGAALAAAEAAGDEASEDAGEDA